ncbi:non-ltr retroelement reverse transcriptase [Hordeum vulgare]|nr:non-ltr retroelement reverse transcriptase [Hordeum vulgare]
MRASLLRKKNMIKVLQYSLGVEISDPEELKNLATDFYQSLYLYEGVNNMDAVLDHVQCKVTAEMNASLCAPYTKEDVKGDLFWMFPTKAPGPDGFCAHFYQRHWEVCGDEVTSIVLRIVTGVESPESINDTVLVLIPKVTNPTILAQFRPISLCNVMYKIASKVIANRLKVVLSGIISEKQSAFVPGRLITNNIICAYECLHFMKRLREKSNSFCALKLDMMKAYDRMEWAYLKGMMIRLGFDQRWIDIAMGMVSSVLFSVCFNGERLEVFKPTCGIRQGDPISPYLFLIATEGLSCLLKSSSQSSLTCIHVAHTAPTVNHLLFVDDSLLLFKASVEGSTLVSNLLDTYCNAYGQRINNEKSSIFFSRGCSPQMRDTEKNNLLVHNESLSGRYLGMPTDVGHSKNGTFKFLRDHVWEKIKGWMAKLLSSAGKEVLINSIAQAIHVFSMACFRLPWGLCENITSIIQQLWWGSKQGRRKPSWVAWDTMTLSKHLGGMGFRYLEIFNLALLARHAWRTLTDYSSLSARILKAVCFPNCSMLEIELGAHPSQIWRAILDRRDILAEGIIRHIGDGRTTYGITVGYLGITSKDPLQPLFRIPQRQLHN